MAGERLRHSDVVQYEDGKWVRISPDMAETSGADLIDVLGLDRESLPPKTLEILEGLQAGAGNVCNITKRPTDAMQRVDEETLAMILERVEQRSRPQ